MAILSRATLSGRVMMGRGKVGRSWIGFVLIANVSLLVSRAQGLPLYMVEKGDKRSWLLGTEHLYIKALPEPVRALTQNARKLMVETNLTTGEVANALADQIEAELKTSGVQRVIFPELKSSLAEVFFVNNSNPVDRLSSMSLDDFAKLSPPLARVLIDIFFMRAEAIWIDVVASKVDLISRIDASAEQFDRLLQLTATESQVEIGALDSKHVLIQASDSVEEGELKSFLEGRIQRLKNLLKTPSKTIINHVQQYEGWQTDALDRLISWLPEQGERSSPPIAPWASKDEGSDSFWRSAKARHKDWLPMIEKELGLGGVLIAVGDGHVSGENEDSLVRQLQKKGYQVTFIGNPEAPKQKVGWFKFIKQMFKPDSDAKAPPASCRLLFSRSSNRSIVL